MKKMNLKKTVVYLIGGILANIPVFGIYPLGIAFFTAAYMENISKGILFFIITGCMFYTAPLLTAARYVISMILVVVLTELMEEYGKVPGRWMGAAFAGGNLFLMNACDRLLSVSSQPWLAKSILESVFVFSFSILLMRGMGEYFELENKESHRESFLNSYGRDRFKEFSESFRKLANTFQTIQSPGDTRMHESGNVYWKNRLVENRLAIAGQLNEMSKLMLDTAEDVFDMDAMESNIEESIKRRLRKMNILVKKIFVIEKKEAPQEILITMKTEKKECVSTREIAGYLSEVCKKRMIPSDNSKSILGNEFKAIKFIEDTNFKVLYGVAKANKNNEGISGDNFSVINTPEGRLYLCLSDGMGSGIQANNESEVVIELIEQFLEAGFCKETAIRMINSTLLMKSEDQTFSTIDVSEIDLYSGVCEVIKIGASTTFIKRNDWVESIQSTSLPAGMFCEVDFDTVSKKMYDGDFIIMTTDGIIDGIDAEDQERIVGEIIRNAKTNNPREMANIILNEILQQCHGTPIDDMTVLVGGIWEK